MFEICEILKNVKYLIFIYNNHQIRKVTDIDIKNMTHYKKNHKKTKKMFNLLQ